MPWEANAPLGALDEAAFTYQHISGIDAIIEWHQRELARLQACRALVVKRRAEVEATVATPSIDAEWTDKTVTQLTDAVNFYARHDIYKGRKGEKPAVVADGGAIARKAIQEVYGEESNGHAQ